METKIINRHPTPEIIIPDGSEYTLIDNFYVDSAVTEEANHDLKIIIGHNCQIKYISIWTADYVPTGLIKRELIVGDDSYVDSYRAYFGKDDSQGEITYRLGTGVNLVSEAIFFQTTREYLGIKEKHIFTAPRSQGRFSVTGLLGGEAKAKFHSDIIIEPSAQQTDSRIDMKLYLLNKGVKGEVLPGLQIAANDVKAGHGASTFSLSPDDMFYLRSRGLNPDQIKQLVITSATSRFVASLNYPEAEKMINTQIERKTLSL